MTGARCSALHSKYSITVENRCRAALCVGGQAEVVAAAMLLLLHVMQFAMQVLPYLSYMADPWPLSVTVAPVVLEICIR